MHRNVESSRHHGERLGFRDWSNYKIGTLGKSNRAVYRERMAQLQERWDSRDFLSDVSDGSDVETVSAADDKKIGRQLWGCSSFEEPIRANVLAEVLEEHLGESEKETGGLTTRLEQLRSSFLERTFCANSDSIPANQKFDDSKPCGVVHPDVCKRQIVPSMKACLIGLEQELKVAPAGSL